MRRIKNHSFGNNLIFIFKDEKKNYEKFYNQDINCHNAWKDDFEKRFLSDKSDEEKEDFRYYLEYYRTSSNHELGIFQAILAPIEIGFILAIFQFASFPASLIVFFITAIFMIILLMVDYYGIANRIRFLDEVIDTFFKKA